MTRLTDEQIARLPRIEQRKAISNRNLNDRADRIRGNLDARQQRLAEGLARDLAEILPPERPQPRLPREQRRGGIPAARGYSEQALQPGTGNEQGGGIASPLTEEHFSTREYWPTGIPSSDGLFMFPAPKKVTMTDANGAEVIFDYADPSAPVPVE